MQKISDFLNAFDSASKDADLDGFKEQIGYQVDKQDEPEDWEILMMV